MRVVVVVGSEGNLLEIVLRLRSRGCFAHLLDGRQQQAEQDQQHGQDQQQLEQGEAGTLAVSHRSVSMKGSSHPAWSGLFGIVRRSHAHCQGKKALKRSIRRILSSAYKGNARGNEQEKRQAQLRRGREGWPRHLALDVLHDWSSTP